MPNLGWAGWFRQQKSNTMKYKWLWTPDCQKSQGHHLLLLSWKLSQKNMLKKCQKTIIHLLTTNSIICHLQYKYTFTKSSLNDMSLSFSLILWHPTLFNIQHNCYKVNNPSLLSKKVALFEKLINFHFL